MSDEQPQYVSPLALIGGRVRHVEEMCRSAVALDAAKGRGLTDRAWLAQSVLNILHGSIDDQISEEVRMRRRPLPERIANWQLRHSNP